MKNFIQIYWKTLLFFAIAGLVGGFFTGISVLDSYPPEMQQQLLDELTTRIAVVPVQGVLATGIND